MRTADTTTTAPARARHRRGPAASDDTGGTPLTLFPDNRPDAVRIAALGGVDYLRPDDVDALNDAERRAFDVLADGQPHHAADIIRAVGGYDALRRARALRGRRAHIDGRTVMLSLTCRRGEGMAGVYTLHMHPVDDEKNR